MLFLFYNNHSEETENNKVFHSVLASSHNENWRSNILNANDFNSEVKDLTDWQYGEKYKTIVKYFLQFFRKVDAKVTILNQKKAKQPFVDNYGTIVNALVEEYNRFLINMFEGTYLINWDDFKRHDLSLLKYFNKKIDKALDRAHFVQVEVSHDDPSMARQVALDAFSSINSTGEPLAAFDIMMSDLHKMYNSDNNCDKIKQFQKFIFDNIDSFPFTKKAAKDDILKFYFAAVNKDYKKQKLYNQFLKNIKNLEKNDKSKKHELFVDEFTNFIKICYNISKGLIIKDHYSSSLHLLGHLAKKNKTIFSPIYLILISQKFKLEEKNKIITLIYIKFLQYLIIQRGHTKNLTNIFEKIMIKIEEETAAGMLHEIKNIFDFNINKENLRNILTDRNVNFYNETGKQIIILKEAHLRSKRKTGGLPLHGKKLDFNLIEDGTIEHIYPKSVIPKGKELKNLIGNFTILPQSLNSSAGCKEYKDKIIYHYKSELLFSLDIIQHHIDKYNENKEEGYKISSINSIESEEVSGNRNKYITKILDNKKSDVSSSFKNEDLDLNWLIGSSIKNDKDDEIIYTAGEHLEDIISLLVDEDEIEESLKAISDKNSGCYCKPQSIHEDIVW
ncbi:DUF1524 domain-containing protein [Lentisphaerota bacterium WC36G]|nr:HNH endonuclease family protein [Lentisphaerae bacterium WC36]